MDTLRGTFDTDGSADRDWDAPEEESAEPASRRDLPPDSIGQDERRMQVRAYNHWAGLLGERMFPHIDDLDPSILPDFGPHSVLLDFSLGIDNPAVRFLGHTLAQECGAGGVITRLSDVPPRSLLSRITDHYMQILANQAPIGFEAEFVNNRGVAILYRGILLPYSSDDSTIDFIYGVINWKEMADQLTADELLLEIDQALELGADLEVDDQPLRRPADPVTDWADSPAHENDEAPTPSRYHQFAVGFGEEFGVVSPLDSPLSDANEGADEDEDEDDALPDFSHFSLSDDDEEYDEDEGEGESAGYSFASLADYIEAPAKKAIDPTEFTLQPYDEDEAPYAEDAAGEPDEAGPVAPVVNHAEAADMAPVDDTALGHDIPLEDASGSEEVFAPVDAPAVAEPAAMAPEERVALHAIDDVVLTGYLPEDAGLHDCLASARELARTADTTEDRSRSALYAAVGRAYDFSIAAQAAPQDYADLIASSGLTVQDRAPMTPIVKLVFGHDYDKTRLTEYAAVLTHAHRLRLDRGSLAGFLAETEGGLKAVVKAERRLRREGEGKPSLHNAAAVREALAEQLRALEAITLEELDGAGAEFALVLIRRDEIGCAEILAELPEDIAQIERAARRLVG